MVTKGVGIQMDKIRLTFAISAIMITNSRGRSDDMSTFPKPNTDKEVRKSSAILLRLVAFKSNRQQ